MLGAYLNEVALVALFLGLVLLSSKIGKIGEAIGGLFEQRGEPASGGQADETPPKAP